MGLPASLGLGVGAAMVWQGAALRGDTATRSATIWPGCWRPPSTTRTPLVLAPRLRCPGGPGRAARRARRVRALIARRWRGQYRVRGRGWEMDTRSRAEADPTSPTLLRRRWRGRCRDPLDARARSTIRASASCRGRLSATVPAPSSSRADRGEIVTVDNAPGGRPASGRVQRLDAQRAASVRGGGPHCIRGRGR